MLAASYAHGVSSGKVNKSPAIRQSSPVLRPHLPYAYWGRSPRIEPEDAVMDTMPNLFATVVVCISIAVMVWGAVLVLKVLRVG
jgi:hypothetical protein